MKRDPKLPCVSVVMLLTGLCALPALAAEPPATTDVANASHLDVSSARLASLIKPAPSDWQNQYDIAKSRKAGGKKKMFIGLGLDAAGVATVFLSANNCVNKVTDLYSDCSGNVSAILRGGLMGAGGGITFIWGLIEYIDANGDVRSLERQRPAGQDQTASIPVGEHQSV